MTITILHLDSSARIDQSVTRQLSAAAVAKLKMQHPDAAVIYRDLTMDPLPHISPEFLGGIFGNSAHADHATVMLSDRLVDELLTADYLVIGVPMYNFNVPSQLKAWIDYVCRAGKTFKYGASGAEGLLPAGKKAIIAAATGGFYREGPLTAFDHVTPYLKQVLGFLGITDIVAIKAEKQGFAPDIAAAELASAQDMMTAKLKAA